MGLHGYGGMASPWRPPPVEYPDAMGAVAKPVAAVLSPTDTLALNVSSDVTRRGLDPLSSRFSSGRLAAVTRTENSPTIRVDERCSVSLVRRTLTRRFPKHARQPDSDRLPVRARMDPYR
jgi:hypothetical protein